MYKKTMVKRSFRYLAISAFLVVFNLIYGLFSHGIGSDYMRFAFLIPLVGGCLVTLLLTMLPEVGFLPANIWRMGIATIVVGSLLHGVFDIYGTEVSYVAAFFYAGGAMLLIALVLYIIPTWKSLRNK